MSTVHFIYHCELCDRQYSDSLTNGTKTAAIVCLVDAQHGIDRPNTPPPRSIHLCEDQRLGMSTLIGAEVKETP